MSKPKKRSQDELTAQVDLTAFAKCQYQNELIVNGQTPPELTSCTIIDKDLGLPIIQTQPLPTSISVSKQQSQNSLLIYPPNTKLTDWTTPQFIPGRVAGICDDPTEFTEINLYQMLQWEQFKIAVMSIFKSEKKQQTPSSENQLQLIFHLNCLKKLGLSIQPILGKNQLNITQTVDKTANTYALVSALNQQIQVPCVNFVADAVPYYLNQSVKIRGNDGESYELNLAYTSILNCLIDNSMMDLPALLNIQKNVYPIQQLTQQLPKNKAVCISTRSFQKFLKKKANQFFEVLIQKGLLKGDLIPFDRPPSGMKEGEKAPSRGEKRSQGGKREQVQDVRQIPKTSFGHSGEAANSQSLDHKMKILKDNINYIIEELVPSKAEILVDGIFEYKGMQYAKIIAVDEVLCVVLNTFDKVNDNQQMEKVFSLFRSLAKQYNTDMPGSLPVQFTDFVPDEDNGKSKHEYFEEEETDIKIPVLRKTTRQEAVVHKKKARSDDFEPVWIDGGYCDDDLFADDYSGLRECYVPITELEQYFDQAVCYGEKNEASQVMFKSAQALVQKKAAKDTVVQQQAASSFVFELSSAKAAQYEKAQPNPLRKNFSAPSTQSAACYQVHVEQGDDAVLLFKSIYTRWEGVNERMLGTRLQFVWQEDGAIKRLTKEYKQDEIVQLKDIKAADFYVLLEIMYGEEFNSRGANVQLSGSCSKTTIIQIDQTTASGEFYNLSALKTQAVPMDLDGVCAQWELKCKEESQILLAFEFAEPVSTVKYSVTVVDDRHNTLVDETIFFQFNSKFIEVKRPPTAGQLYVVLRAKQTAKQGITKDKDKKPLGCFATPLKLHAFGPVESLTELPINEQSEALLTIAKQADVGYQFVLEQPATVMFSFEQLQLQQNAQPPQPAELPETKTLEILSQAAVGTSPTKAQASGSSGVIADYLIEAGKFLEDATRQITVEERIPLRHMQIVVLQPSQQLQLRFAEEGIVHLVIYSSQPVQMGQVNFAEQAVSRVTGQLFTREYAQYADFVRKQAGLQIQVQSTDLAKLQYATQMKLAIIQEQKGKQKQMEFIQPHQHVLNLLGQNKLQPLDNVLVDDVMTGVPVDPKKKPADKKGQKGFIQEILEEELKVNGQKEYEKIQIRETKK